MTTWVPKLCHRRDVVGRYIRIGELDDDVASPERLGIVRAGVAENVLTIVSRARTAHKPPGHRGRRRRSG